MLPKNDPLTPDRCANCGCPETNIRGGNLADGEGVCSVECYDEHDNEGCPLESDPPAYRECPHAP
jgi:hypothetical protein